jgi:indole-3-glycerol phosphate synthase
MESEVQAPGVLGAILAETAARLEGRGGERSSWERRAAARRSPPPFAAALRGASVGVIAEVKRRSPSMGPIREGADAPELAARYASAGAVAISVLTEPTRFGGSLEDLEAVARAVRLPVLRKDFVIHPLQVYEARACGAAAVLLIVRALTDEQLQELAALAHHLGLDTLVEVHAAGEVTRALACAPRAVGVNARDLGTLVMDGALVGALLPGIPEGIAAVAESGLASRADVERVALAGADAVLVGTAAAKALDPGAVVAAMSGVVRRGRGEGGAAGDTAHA